MVDTVDKVAQLLRDLDDGHTEFQLDRFVVARNGAGTLWGRYRQALRELKSRYEALEGMEIEHARTRLSIEEKNTELGAISKDVWATDYEARRLQLDIAELELKQKRELAARDTAERELSFFVATADELRGKLGVLSPAKRKALEHGYWVNKLRLQAALDISCMGRVQIGTLEIIASLPDDDRRSLLVELGKEAGYRTLERLERRGFELADHSEEIPPAQDNGKA